MIRACLVLCALYIEGVRLGAAKIWNEQEVRWHVSMLTSAEEDKNLDLFDKASKIYGYHGLRL